MKRRFLLPLIACGLLVVAQSCSEDEAVYPSLLTEMADLHTDAQGILERIVLDDGRSFRVGNPQPNYEKNVVYRVVCSYLPQDSTALLYQLTGAYVLRDSSEIALTHPTQLRSAWRTPRYINLHLAPKTQGGRQYWGFITDSVTTRLTDGGDTLTHAYLTLHHNQGQDPASYTQEVYASIPLDSIPEAGASSPVTLRIHTFDGVKVLEL